MDFREKLAERQYHIGSALCVGLDPDPKHLPDRFKGANLTDSIRQWMYWVVHETVQYASMYKLQRAYYEALPRGEKLLRELVSNIKLKYSDIPVFIDSKRGDIDRTQQKYRSAIFELDEADGTNVCCYMGGTPFIEMFDPEHPERSIVNLIYTSNPAAREIQEAMTSHGDPFWLFMAKCTLTWARERKMRNVGFVMAAAYKRGGDVYDEHLRLCRQLDKGEVWYLMPGFGAQGGFVEASVQAAWAGWGSLAMNASSSISNTEDPKEAARLLYLQIADAIASR